MSVMLRSGADRPTGFWGRGSISDDTSQSRGRSPAIDAPESLIRAQYRSAQGPPRRSASITAPSLSRPPMLAGTAFPTKDASDQITVT